MSLSQSNQAGPSSIHNRNNEQQATFHLGMAPSPALLAAIQASAQQITTTAQGRNAGGQMQLLSTNMTQQLVDISRLTNAVVSSQDTRFSTPVLCTSNSVTEPQSQISDQQPQSSNNIVNDLQASANNNITQPQLQNANVPTDTNNSTATVSKNARRKKARSPSQRSDQSSGSNKESDSDPFVSQKSKSDEDDSASSTSSYGRRGIGNNYDLNNRTSRRKTTTTTQGQQPLQPTIPTTFFGANATNQAQSQAQNKRPTRQRAQTGGVTQRGRPRAAQHSRRGRGAKG